MGPRGLTASRALRPFLDGEDFSAVREEGAVGALLWAVEPGGDSASLGLEASAVAGR